MTTTKTYISVREASQILQTTEQKIMEMIDKGELQAYRIADQFLRLKRSEVLNIQRGEGFQSETISYPYSAGERMADFFYFNDFYIVAACIIILLLYIVFYT